MSAINTRAAALAILATIAMLGSISTLADSEHREALAQAAESTAVASAYPVQQVVIVGKRTPA